MQSETSLVERPFMFFYAMKVKPDTRRCFEVLHPFVITLATLETDPDDSSSGVVTLWYRAPLKEKILLCTLSPQHPQQTLEIFFFSHDVITLYTCGKGTVNLIGKAKAKRPSVKSGEDDDDDDESDVSWHPGKEKEEVASEASPSSSSEDDEDKMSENEGDGSQEESPDSGDMSVESVAEEADSDDDDEEESEEEPKPEDDPKESNGVTKFEAINAQDAAKKKSKEIKKNSAESISGKEQSGTEKDSDQHKKSKKQKKRKEPIKYMLNK